MMMMENKLWKSSGEQRLFYLFFLIMAVGICFTYSIYQTYGTPNFMGTDLRQRNINYYGTDYLAYEWFRKATPPTTRILILVPDTYYLAKALVFLYPRQITAFYNPSNLNEFDLAQYDYLFIYPSIDRLNGYISGLNYYQSKYKWTFEQLFEIDKQLAKEVPSKDLETFLNKVRNQQGNIIYQLN